MAQATTKPTEATTAELQQQVEALKADIAALTDTMTSLGKQKVSATKGEVEQQAAALRARGKDAMDYAGSEVERLSGEAERTVRERPMTSLAVAAGVGVLFGLLTARK
ncbi:Membrane-anchored ribosome-binding protein, inhibits growth in stationary phase, ElaB/YqjD/DUF883 family [Monaibacterium marinum]|uniref:Membrane-anchored ribosome-binding protein, inhibits growth in stationary phase, ElaB/YqjD/DUF883 family n=1 Tax=Pontivivens marinum TaxID=1690039 RepID=A0A2C9CN71_9RHOB|nr:DUF883 family protein [Monaibacterium marinum]SOH92971.1 Membrane-anchored ribosome-binding protein, inhibits growth in stationary phase, ElaB/YqjD/DUF883 family [Monaibacterium marinum]